MAGVRAALQGAGPPVPSTSLMVSTPVVRTGTSSSATTVTSLRSVPLPSFPRRNGARSGYLNQRNVKTYTKEVVCLPFFTRVIGSSLYPEETLTKLAQAGFVGKISFSTEWSEDQLRNEITAIFRGAFGLSEHQSFPFQFLSTIKGCKKLMKPRVTSNFPWGGKEVASVCSSTCLYIMAGMEVPAQNVCVELSDDSDFESPVLQTAERTARQNEATIHFADFIPIDVEEDEAIDEAIRRSLLEESVQSLQDSRFAKTLSKEEITGIVKAHKLFRLLVKAIYKESGAFEESPNGFILRMNIAHVQNRVYRTVGQMMSTIIVQGGEPPVLLSPLVVDYLLTGNIFHVNVTPDDVADMELREALNKVDQAATKDELEQAVESCDAWRYQIEGLPNPVSMDNKDAFVQNAILFHVLIQRQSCYDQLVEGLKYYEVLPLLKENPGMRVLLDMPKQPSDVTAGIVAALLKPNYSVLGSNRRPREEMMVVKFREFLHCVQEKEIGERLNARNLTEAESAFILTLNPGHILAFATGSSKVPAIGFVPTPKLTFVHDDTKHLPLAHTCSNELQIFVNKNNLADDDEFDYHFLVALMNGAIFSAV
ncbi:hypothetical protein UPYG_G00234150 [Umbra pygmaea]|uniref:HECT domain-containing protein n=1 Tax=Umbra pygmaea TaxID=75934 RepID=A0ABD0WEV9_UMBPY